MRNSVFHTIRGNDQIPYLQLYLVVSNVYAIIIQPNMYKVGKIKRHVIVIVNSLFGTILTTAIMLNNTIKTIAFPISPSNPRTIHSIGHTPIHGTNCKQSVKMPLVNSIKTLTNRSMSM